MTDPAGAPPLLATPAYAAAMAAMHEAAFPPAERWDAAAIAVQLGLPGVFGLLDPAGGMALARAAADEAEILTLAVVPSARRRGIARTLLEAAAARVAQAGGRAIFLEVSAANDPARALYEQSGYREVGRRKRYYADGSDALVLCRLLSPAAAKGG